MPEKIPSSTAGAAVLASVFSLAGSARAEAYGRAGANPKLIRRAAPFQAVPNRLTTRKSDDPDLDSADML